MGLITQTVVDCSHPHQLADWWAETLEWAVEPQDEAFIRSMVDQGYATEEQTLVRRELEARGATFLWTASEGPHSWHTMADPEGNEFCIS